MIADETVDCDAHNCSAASDMLPISADTTKYRNCVRLNPKRSVMVHGNLFPESDHSVFTVGRGAPRECARHSVTNRW